MVLGASSHEQDTELIAHLICDVRRQKWMPLEEAVRQAMTQVPLTPLHSTPLHSTPLHFISIGSPEAAAAPGPRGARADGSHAF